MDIVMYLRVVMNGCLAVVCLAWPVSTMYAEEPCSLRSVLGHNLYHRLDWSPAELAREITKETESGNISGVEVFVAIVDAIRKENSVPHQHEKVSRLIESVAPEDTPSLIDTLSFGIGPGHAYTNLIIARLLLNREMTIQQQERLCRAIATIFVESKEEKRLVVIPSMSPAQMAADSIEILANLGRLSGDSFRACLEVLRANNRTNEGKWLARFLYRHMPIEVAIQNLDIIVDILEEPPQDGTARYDYDQGVCVRVPHVFRLPHTLLNVSEMSRGDDSLLTRGERNFLAWCNKTCAVSWPKTTADAMRLLIIRTGGSALHTLMERIADPSKNQQTRLTLLACAAQISPDSDQVKHYLLEILRTSRSPNWMLASEVARSVEMSEAYSTELRGVWAKWHDYNGCKSESNYRFLFAIGYWQEGMRLLDASLPTADTSGPSPPFYMFFLEDVPYAPERYERVLIKLLNGKIWWHRCAAVVMISRYTDHFTNHSHLLMTMAEEDQEPLVRAICRQIQRAQPQNSAKDQKADTHQIQGE